MFSEMSDVNIIKKIDPVSNLLFQYFLEFHSTENFLCLWFNNPLYHYQMKFQTKKMNPVSYEKLF